MFGCLLLTILAADPAIEADLKKLQEQEEIDRKKKEDRLKQLEKKKSFFETFTTPPEQLKTSLDDKEKDKSENKEAKV